MGKGFEKMFLQKDTQMTNKNTVRGFSHFDAFYNSKKWYIIKNTSKEYPLTGNILLDISL